jgi:hypothetical protein
MKLSVLITTIGRPSLQRMLESLACQLHPQDRIYLAVEGHADHSLIRQQIESIKIKYPNLNVSVMTHPTTLGSWGHGLRNYYQKSLKGDFILHGDDDDVYTPNAIEAIRFRIRSNLNADLFVFQMWRPYHTSKYGELFDLIPIKTSHGTQMTMGDIGTPCGVVKNIPDKFGEWKLERGGDYHFWQQTANAIGAERIQWCREIIYEVNAPTQTTSPTVTRLEHKLNLSCVKALIIDLEIKLDMASFGNYFRFAEDSDLIIIQNFTTNSNIKELSSCLLAVILAQMDSIIYIDSGTDTLDIIPKCFMALSMSTRFKLLSTLGTLPSTPSNTLLISHKIMPNYAGRSGRLIIHRPSKPTIQQWEQAIKSKVGGVNATKISLHRLKQRDQHKSANYQKSRQLIGEIKIHE